MEIHTPSSLLATHTIGAPPGRPALLRWIKRVPTVLSRLWLAIRRERKLGRAIAELESFDDRLLADIGIGRGDIEHAVRGERPPSRRRPGTHDADRGVEQPGGVRGRAFRRGLPP